MVPGPIWSNLELIQALMKAMSSLPASMKWIRSRTAEKKWQHRFSYYKLWVTFFRRSRPANSAVGCPIWLNFELLRAPMHVIITCKYKKNWMEKKAEKKWQDRFLHYKPMGAICCHGNQSFNPIWPKSCCSFSSILMMLLIRFHCDRPTGCRDIIV